jgi:NADPH-dependent 2,4-dienoyl-CoA reductase/sulfur reductase-like enzyme
MPAQASTVPAIVIAGAGGCGTRAAFALRELICGGAALSEAGITFLAGVEVTRVDTAGHALELDDGRRLPYRSLLLATGARARSSRAAATPDPAVLADPAAALKSVLRSPVAG